MKRLTFALVLVLAGAFFVQIQSSEPGDDDGSDIVNGIPVWQNPETDDILFEGPAPQDDPLEVALVQQMAKGICQRNRQAVREEFEVLPIAWGGGKVLSYTDTDFTVRPTCPSCGDKGQQPVTLPLPAADTGRTTLQNTCSLCGETMLTAVEFLDLRREDDPDYAKRRDDIIRILNDLR